MEDLLKEMSAYVCKTNEESKRIHDVLVKFVEQQGEIETYYDCEDKDIICAFMYNEFADSFSDYIVDRVRVENGQLLVHVLDYYSEEENDGWFAVMGGMFVVNATLYNLCECLHEFV